MAFVSTGIVISFDSGFLAEILEVTGPSMTRESIPSSHMGTTNDHTFLVAKLVDGGELTVSIAYDPSEVPPIHEDPETVTLTFPDSSAATKTFTGFMTAFEMSAPLEERATASCTIKATGAIATGP